MSVRGVKFGGAAALVLALAASLSTAQTLTPDSGRQALPYPYNQPAAQPPASTLAAQPAPTDTAPPQPAPAPPPERSPPPSLVTTSPAPPRTPMSDADGQAVIAALNAARNGNTAGVRSAISVISDPTGRRIAQWALTEASPDAMSFLEAETARRELAGWPHAQRRQVAAERLIDTSGMGPSQIVAWFGGGDPATGQGALSLASALSATGRNAEAAAVVRKAWRTIPFDVDVQRNMLARFASVLTADDHVTRADMLLYGPQGEAAKAMIALLPADQQALAQARMAVRSNSAMAPALIAALPANLQNAPGLAYERVLYARERGRMDEAQALAAYMPDRIPYDGAAERLWKRGSLVIKALQAGDTMGAYAIAAHTGLTQGADAADAEFYAGWLALTRMKDPKRADVHFAKLQTIGFSPLTQSRALYWRGRAAEAQGETMDAQLFYGQSARYYTTFYGQLAAAKTGQRVLTLDKDPEITPIDRARFESREAIRATRALAEIGAKDTFKMFVASLAEVLPTAQEEALLVDLARGYGDQEVSMKAVRNAAKRGFILPERGYPIRMPPRVDGGAETALVLGITRQESSFDPRARSGPGARGMMQLMPGTATVVARRLGIPYNPSQLDDPDYNMQLGSAFLGQLVNQFSGSYVMASAAYNAGPGRPTQWSTVCGDPRSGGTDPLNFIECIPFSETRDYVMRVMEGAQVYRARLAGGSAPLTLAQDLKRGGYVYGGPSVATTLPAPPATPQPSVTAQ